MFPSLSGSAPSPRADPDPYYGCWHWVFPGGPQTLKCPCALSTLLLSAARRSLLPRQCCFKNSPHPRPHLFPLPPHRIPFAKARSTNVSLPPTLFTYARWTLFLREGEEDGPKADALASLPRIPFPCFAKHACASTPHPPSKRKRIVYKYSKPQACGYGFEF